MTLFPHFSPVNTIQHHFSPQISPHEPHGGRKPGQTGELRAPPTAGDRLRLAAPVTGKRNDLWDWRWFSATRTAATRRV